MYLYRTVHEVHVLIISFSLVAFLNIKQVVEHKI